MIASVPRPRLLERISVDRHTAIEASAGTGKTYTIEHLVIDLILRERVTLSEILVLTFTDRAATELRERIRSKIEKILSDADRFANRPEASSDANWTIDDRARDDLTRALNSFDAASIGTIHGFFGRLLAEYAFSSGRLFDGTLEDGRGLFGRAFKLALRGSLAKRPGNASELLELWIEQGRGGVEALEALLWRCHKTRRRILPEFSLDALKQEVCESPLFAGDLNEAAEQFQTELKRAKVHGNTTKSIVKKLTILADLVGSGRRDWRIAFDRPFQKAISDLAESLKKHNFLDERTRQITDAIIRFMDVSVTLDAAIVQTSLPIVRETLNREKARTGKFDFDDQIEGVARLLEGSHADELVRAVRSRFRYALIDEFQDTDELQWKFFERTFLQSDGKHQVFLIGDPKQAIYGFRGADVETYLRARHSIVESGTPVVPLEENFRSTPRLVTAYNRILDQSARPPFFTGEIVYDRPVKAGHELVALERDGSPAVPIHLLTVDQEHEEKLSTGEYRRSLARAIAREASDLLSERKPLFFGPVDNTTRIGPGDVFVLTSTNDEAVQVALALRDVEVPFAFYKQEGLFQTPEARAIHDLLAAIADPTDPEKRRRAWITPFFAVPLAALPALGELQDNNPFIQRLREWEELASQHRFESLFTRILDDTGIIQREIMLNSDERALTNFLHIFELLLEEARAIGRNLADLIAVLNAYIQKRRKPPGADGDLQRLESDRAAVQVMTIHKSKGLEAAVVFLYGGFGRYQGAAQYEYHADGERLLYIGDNEVAKAAAELERTEEEQRLYYVALTRAKARLYLPLAPEKLGGKTWSGRYKHLNDRLTAMVKDADGDTSSSLVKTISIAVDRTPQATAQSRLAAGDPSVWQPERSFLEVRDPSGLFSRYRQNRYGFHVTSYSQMKRLQQGELDPLERDVFQRDSVEKELMTDDATDLPGGTATGIMLHEVFQHIPFESLHGDVSLHDWRELKAVTALFDAALLRNGLSQIYRARAEELVYYALTATLALTADRSIPGLRHCRDVIREMEFLFPIPEEAHPLISDIRPAKLVVNRGFIKGFVDLVIKHDNQVYFADWKSDTLRSYDQNAIKEHVEKTYNLQQKLYSLALVKAIGINSEKSYERFFGGSFYVFLRGLTRSQADARAIYFDRPSWSDIVGYEAELKEGGERFGKGA